MGLVHEDDVDWFLTLDETHHEFSTVGARGGAAAGRYVNPSFPRSGERCIVSTFHTTWVLAGSLVDIIGHPRLNKKDSLALVKFLLPKVDILEELKLKTSTR
jgi:hypothetical protein